MSLFSYNLDQRAAILESLPGPICFGTYVATDDEVVAVLAARAAEYIQRARMSTVEGIREKLDALEVVKELFSEPVDLTHRERIANEIDRWNAELDLINRPKEHRARLRFIVEAFEVFAHAEGSFSPLVSTIALSESGSPAARFFESAIAPVCRAAGEGLKMRAAINAFKVFRDEIRAAEIDLIRSEVECAARAGKT
ncbi:MULTISPECIES: hypothetical protein [unclassified Rhizobium]|uniref:hypothetical protein n=1 Tax=unclassified Rhizobium TaxID=2613769 RepID=UPI000BDA30B1|nr:MULTISPECIES: hypothetical protein [unclassified Rhizobium]MDH7805521.1 hypothetical protein [Rhizobium sp. AN67]MDQ4407031.1 hypothetical protein [Rhizobium sp. AN63]SOD60240.1 hypothetical protein SAMN05216595_5157 [Rhizobium sp. AN6A]